jgi:signal transduction histidine kinase
MLHAFIATHRLEIIVRTQTQLKMRAWPSASALELESGVPLFLNQLSETLRLEDSTTPYPGSAIGNTATVHGRELRALGFTVSQVVHDYGDICQAITEVALEQGAPISVEEFHTLNRCLDTAIAEAVTEHARGTAETHSAEHLERLGHVSHELRDLLNTALLAFQSLKRGNLGINGSTGAVLGRTLVRMNDFVASTLSEVRLSAAQQRRERVSAAAFLAEVVAASTLHAEYLSQHFLATPVAPDLMIDVDPQLLASAVSNLVSNAFKYSAAGATVTLSAARHADRLVIAVQDACGGLPVHRGDPFEPFGQRRGSDRTGLGLGLSIARAAVRAHGGDIDVRNLPGVGCIFSIDIPLAPGDETPRAVPAS